MLTAWPDILQNEQNAQNSQGGKKMKVNEGLVTTSTKKSKAGSGTIIVEAKGTNLVKVLGCSEPVSVRTGVLVSNFTIAPKNERGVIALALYVQKTWQTYLLPINENNTSEEYSLIDYIYWSSPEKLVQVYNDHIELKYKDNLYTTQVPEDPEEDYYLVTGNAICQFIVDNNSLELNRNAKHKSKIELEKTNEDIDESLEKQQEAVDNVLAMLEQLKKEDQLRTKQHIDELEKQIIEEREQKEKLINLVEALDYFRKRIATKIENMRDKTPLLRFVKRGVFLEVLDVYCYGGIYEEAVGRLFEECQPIIKAHVAKQLKEKY